MGLNRAIETHRPLYQVLEMVRGFVEISSFITRRRQMEKEKAGIAFVLYRASGGYGLWFDFTKAAAESEVATNNCYDGENRELVGFVEFDESSYVTDILKGLAGLERDKEHFGHDRKLEGLLTKIFETGVAEGKKQK
jgi:hypothetical protein